MKKKNLILTLGVVGLAGSIAFGLSNQPRMVLAEGETTSETQEEDWKTKVEEEIKKVQDVYNQVVNYQIGGIAVGTIIGSLVSVMLTYFLDKKGIRKTGEMIDNARSVYASTKELAENTDKKAKEIYDEFVETGKRYDEAIKALAEATKQNEALMKAVAKMTEENAEIKSQAQKLEEILAEILKYDPELVKGGLYEKIYGGK